MDNHFLDEFGTRGVVTNSGAQKIVGLKRKTTMKDQRMIIDLAVVALGAGLSESQAGRVSARKDMRPLVVAVGAALSAAVAPYVADALSSSEAESLSPFGLSATEKMATDIASAAVVAALASYAAERAGLSGYAKAAAVGVASAAGVWVGREAAARFLAKGPSTATKPVSK